MKTIRTILPLFIGLFTIPVVFLFNRIDQEPMQHLNITKSKKHAVEHPGIRELYYLQRLHGNPDIDIHAKLWSEFEKVAANAGLSKSAMTALNSWTEQGPLNYGGRMRGIAFNPVNTNIVYAAAANGGVWKSTNLGLEWKAVTDNMPVAACAAVAVDPNNPNIIFAGTGEPDVFTNFSQSGRGNGTPIFSSSVGVMKSEDGGDSWRLLPFNGGGVHRIAVNPTHSDTLLVATTTGLQKTTNGGQTWQVTLTGTATDVVFKPGSSVKVFAAIGDDRGASGNGVYTSDAGGGRYMWRRLTNNFPAPDSCGRILLGISKANPDRIYAAVAMNKNRVSSSDNDFLAFMVSTNSGDTWERKVNAIASNFTTGQAYYDFAMAISPTDPNMIFLGGLEVHRSTNGGTSFAIMSDGRRADDDPKYVHVDIHAFAFKPDDGQTLLVGCDGGISVTTNAGLTWARRSNNLGTIQYYGINFDPANPANIFGGTQDNGTHAKFSADPKTWYRFYGGDGGNVAIDPVSNNIRYVTTLNIISGQYVRTIVRTSSGGNVALDRGLNGGTSADRFHWLPPILIHPNDRTRLYTASQYVYAMRNPHTGTPSWSAISPDVAPFAIVTDLDISRTSQEWMYTVSSRGDAFLCKNLFSIDPVWTNISNGLPSRWLTDVTVDWDDPNSAYIAASGFGGGHAFMTTNAGQSWIDISGDLPDIPAGAIIRSRVDKNTIFLGTDLGVWVTTNRGVNWVRFGTGFPNTVVYDMKLAHDNTLIAGTHGRGIWTTSAILSTDKQPLPHAYTLGQNYPNPFNPSTAIPFTLAKRERISMKVYDRQGRLVKVLFDGVKEQGEHELSFASSDIPSGTYFYTLETSTQTETRKMVIVK